MAELKNKRQELFCREYIKDMNGAQAAIRAGYSARAAKETASRLLTVDNVAKRLAELQQKVFRKVEISAEDVLKSIINIRDDATQTTDRGEMRSRTDALKANELLGKHLKLFTDKVVVNATVTNKYEKMTDEELEALYSKEFKNESR